MLYLSLKANHKPVCDYYKALKEMSQLSLLHEGAVAPHSLNRTQFRAKANGRYALMVFSSINSPCLASRPSLRF